MSVKRNEVVSMKIEKGRQPNPPVPSAIPCNVCGATEAEQVRSKDRHGGPLRSVICRRCGLVWTDPRPTPEQMRSFYEHEYRLDYKGILRPKLKHIYRSGKVALDRFQRTRSILTSGCRVLDVGAGSGEFVYVLRALGYDASGFEPNTGYARFAAEILGLPVTHAFYQDISMQPASVDVVTIFHTLEHLENPFEALRKAREWLRPEGFLVVEVPNVEAECQQPHTQFHRGHLYHFNIATLEMLGQRTGFAITDHSTSSDGGNITVIFQWTEAPAHTSGEIPDNCEIVNMILRRHSSFRHFFSRYPVIRPLQKVVTRIDEWWHTLGRRSPKPILDKLIEKLRQSRSHDSLSPMERQR